MLKLETIQALRNILLHERMTYKGNEVQALVQILGELSQEENTLRMAARVHTAPVEDPKTSHE
jgi:hypothetical protein